MKSYFCHRCLLFTAERPVSAIAREAGMSILKYGASKEQCTVSNHLHWRCSLYVLHQEHGSPHSLPSSVVPQGSLDQSLLFSDIAAHHSWYYPRLQPRAQAGSRQL